jgi:hypothetical protein
MGSYDSDEEGLIALARQLADAYAEARTRADEDYACDEIAAFLATQRFEAPNEALLAILDLPLTKETYPLVDTAQSTLAGRGPAVVELLLEAVLGEVYDPDGPAPERAAETLDLMDRREAAQGLTEVLCGRGDDELKGVAVDALVALGAFAEPGLAATLDDPLGGDWAQAALEQIRFVREHLGAAPGDEADAFEGFVDDYGPPEDGVDDESEDDAADEDDLGDEVDAGLEQGGEDGGDTGSTEAEGSDDVEPARDSDVGAGARPEPAAAGGPAGPDQEVVDGSYEDFLRRVEQESGGDATTS